MNAPFSLGDLRSGTDQCLGELVPSVAERTVDLLLHVPIPLRAQPGAPRATAEDLARRIGGATPRLDNALLVTHDGDAVVSVNELDIGYHDDPEGGRWFFSTPWERTAASHLLGIAVAVAAARLTGSPVEDETQLTGQRMADPAEIVARLRYDGPPTRPLRDVAPDVLERVGIAYLARRPSLELSRRFCRSTDGTAGGHGIEPNPTSEGRP